MSEVRLHIEHLVVDGVDLAPRDVDGLREALAAEIASGLAEGRGRRLPPGGGAHGTLRAPALPDRTARGALGRAAAHALASVVGPLCGGPPTPGRRHG